MASSPDTYMNSYYDVKDQLNNISNAEKQQAKLDKIQRKSRNIMEHIPSTQRPNKIVSR